MRLFHFTSWDHWTGEGHGAPGIQAAGIRPARHPMIDLPPMVWLTVNEDFAQPWSVRPVPGTGCDRTEVRLEVVIPKDARGTLRDWYPASSLVGQPAFLADLHRFAEPRDWRVFLGRIPAGWVRAVDRRPSVPVPA